MQVKRNEIPIAIGTSIQPICDNPDSYRDDKTYNFRQDVHFYFLALLSPFRFLHHFKCTCYGTTRRNHSANGWCGEPLVLQSQDGYLVRKKIGVSRKRIMSDPAYARTRENIAEFRRGAMATKLLRRAFSSFIRTAADNRVTSRLTSAVMKVIKADAINSRGQRNVLAMMHDYNR